MKVHKTIVKYCRDCPEHEVGSHAGRTPDNKVWTFSSVCAKEKRISGNWYPKWHKLRGTEEIPEWCPLEGE